MLGPLGADLAGVLVPGDHVAAARSAEQVDLPVRVHVNGPCGASVYDVAVERLLDPLLAVFALAGVAEPGDLVADVAGGPHVHMAVAIEIGQGDIVGTEELRGDDVPFPL